MNEKVEWNPCFPFDDDNQGYCGPRTWWEDLDNWNNTQPQVFKDMFLTNPAMKRIITIKCWRSEGYKHIDRDTFYSWEGVKLKDLVKANALQYTGSTYRVKGVFICTTYESSDDDSSLVPYHSDDDLEDRLRAMEWDDDGADAQTLF